MKKKEPLEYLQTFRIVISLILTGLIYYTFGTNESQPYLFNTIYVCIFFTILFPLTNLMPYIMFKSNTKSIFTKYDFESDMVIYSSLIISTIIVSLTLFFLHKIINNPFLNLFIIIISGAISFLGAMVFVGNTFNKFADNTKKLKKQYIIDVIYKDLTINQVEKKNFPEEIFRNLPSKISKGLETINRLNIEKELKKEIKQHYLEFQKWQSNQQH